MSVAHVLPTRASKRFCNICRKTFSVADWPGHLINAHNIATCTCRPGRQPYLFKDNAFKIHTNQAISQNAYLNFLRTKGTPFVNPEAAIQSLKYSIARALNWLAKNKQLVLKGLSMGMSLQEQQVYLDLQQDAAAVECKRRAEGHRRAADEALVQQTPEEIEVEEAESARRKKEKANCNAAYARERRASKLVKKKNQQGSKWIVRMHKQGPGLQRGTAVNRRGIALLAQVAQSSTTHPAHWFVSAFV